VLTSIVLWGMSPPIHAGEASSVSVRVVVSDGVDPQVAAGMFRELGVIWKRAGVRILPFADRLEPRPVAAVSLIVSAGWPPPEASGGLGWIRFIMDGDATPAPVLMVSLAATRALVDASNYRGLSLLHCPLALRRALLARALGRAAAHELGHYLLASREHAMHGLMRARFSAAELICDDAVAFQLEDQARDTLTARLQEAQFLSAEETTGGR